MRSSYKTEMPLVKLNCRNTKPIEEVCTCCSVSTVNFLASVLFSTAFLLYRKLWFCIDGSTTHAMFTVAFLFVFESYHPLLTADVFQYLTCGSGNKGCGFVYCVCVKGSFNTCWLIRERRIVMSRCWFWLMCCRNPLRLLHVSQHALSVCHTPGHNSVWKWTYCKQIHIITVQLGYLWSFVE